MNSLQYFTYVFISYLLGSFIVYLCWNHGVSPVLDIKNVDFSQSIAIYVLSRFLLK